MIFIASKILNFILNPLIWVFIILLIAFYYSKTKQSKRLLLGSLLLLYCFSNAFLFHHINSAWEVQPLDKRQLEKKYAVAIVLGGVAAFDQQNQQIEFHANAGRIFNVLPLYFNNKVDKILLSGGSGKLIPEEKEANILANYLLSIGVDKADLLIENKSRNTYENALFSKALIEENNIEGKFLLSTSAIHMNRAYACFSKQGLEVTPYSADQISYKRKNHFDTLFLPNPQILQYWHQLIHEWIGIIAYKLSSRL